MTRIEELLESPEVTSTAPEAWLDVLAVGVALGRRQMTYENEVTLHEEIAAALTTAGIEHEHEVRLSPASRIDFLTATGVGIEVKVAGSFSTVMRQLIRYSQQPQVHALVLFTTIAAHSVMPRELGLKPLLVCSLIGQGL